MSADRAPAAGDRCDVAVVGAGVVGCAVAYFAAREGLSVHLLERDALAAQASGVAAGMLAPLVEAEDDGPLRHWGLKSLSVLSGLIEELRELSGVDPEYVPCGLLRVATDADEARRLRARAARATPVDGLEWLDEREARAAEPQLAAGVHGALFSPREGHVRSPLLARAFAGAAAALGARVRTGTAVVGLLRRRERVVGLRTTSGACTAGHVVVCTGVQAPDCEAWLDGEVALPVVPVRGQILSLEAPRPPLRRIVWGPDAYLVPRRDGELCVGATQEHVGFDNRVTAEGVHTLLGAALRLVPALAGCGFRGAWAGLRPDTPDHLPLVGTLRAVPGLAIATGHFRNGVLLAPVTGRLVVDALLGKAPEATAAAFAPERFSRAPH